MHKKKNVMADWYIGIQEEWTHWLMGLTATAPPPQGGGGCGEWWMDGWMDGDVVALTHPTATSPSWRGSVMVIWLMMMVEQHQQVVLVHVPGQWQSLFRFSVILKKQLLWYVCVFGGGGEEWWIEWWMYEKIVVVVVLEVVNYVWGAGCVYLLLVYGSMMGMYGVWFGCVMDFWLDVLNYVWGAGCVY